MKAPKPANLTEDKNDGANNEETSPKILYMVTALSLEELKKPTTCHKPKSHLIELSSSLEWLDLHGYLKIVICDLLFPQQPVIEDDRFEITWCIPHVIPQALFFISAADYA